LTTKAKTKREIAMWNMLVVALWVWAVLICIGEWIDIGIIAVMVIAVGLESIRSSLERIADALEKEETEKTEEEEEEETN
jgi:divalent metal cation (Fe/Co/Zn/Cd) transporter